MKGIRCLNVSFKLTENDKVHHWVQHGYFQVGVANRGIFSLF